MAGRLPAFLALGVQALQILLGVVSVPLLLGALGPERFSALSLLWALPSLIPLIDLGLPRAVASTLVRRVPGQPSQPRETLVIAASLQAAVLLAIFVLVWLPFAEGLVPHALQQLPGESGEAAETLGLFLAACSALALFNVIAAFFQAHGKLYHLLAVNAFSGLTISAIPLSVLWATPTLASLGVYTLVLRLVALGLAGGLALGVLGRASTAAAWGRAGQQAAGLLRSGMRSLWYFALSPLLVFGERYIAGYADGRTPIASHLIAVDLGLRFLIVPGVIGQYSFKAIADTASDARGFDAAVARYMPTMSAAYLVPLLGAICFCRELLAAWLGGGHVDSQGVLGVQLVLLAIATCAVSSLLVQTTLASNLMHRLSSLVAVELVIYVPVVFLAVKLRPDALQLSLALSLCWAARVILEAVAMTWLSRGMFANGSLQEFIGLACLVPMLAGLASHVAELLPASSVLAAKAALFVLFAGALHWQIVSRSERRR